MVFGALAVVVALVVGVGVWVALPSGPTQVTDPFAKAVANLASAPALHYQSSLSGQSTSWDVRVTGHGEMVGTVTLADETGSVLAVGGETYVKLPDDVLNDLGSPIPLSVLENKWITGSDVTSDSQLQPILAQLLSPAALAAKLRAALAQTLAYPTTATPDSSVDGVPALMANTPAGDLYVSKTAPYRVLRLTPETPPTILPSYSRLFGITSTQPTPPQISGVPGDTTPPLAHPAAYHRDTPDDTPDTPLENVDQGDTDFPNMTPGDVDDTYNDLEADTKDLATDSVDADIEFNLDGTAQVNCGAGGCTNAATVTSEVTANDPNATIAGGQVNAELTATNTIDGIAAGGCTSTAALPLNGTGTISCANPGAGPTFASELAARSAAAQAQADAQAAANPGVEQSVPYEVDYDVEAFVTATAQVDVQQQVQTEDQQKRAADCAAPSSGEPSCAAIPDAKRLSQDEQNTAARLINDPHYTGGTLSESSDPAYDYVDQYRRTYDAIGTPRGYQNMDMSTFLKSLLGHAEQKQGLNFTVLDLTGASDQQLDTILAYIDKLSASTQKKIIIVGD